jgi:hypothetical protein
MNMYVTFNPTSDNLGILTIWHMRRAVPRPEVLLLPDKSFINVSNMFKKASKRDCRSTMKTVHMV